MSRHMLHDTGHRTDTAQPYGRIMTIITPLLTLSFLIYVVSFQLLHFSFVHATNSEDAQPLSGTLTPLLVQSRLLHNANPQQRIDLSIGLRPRNNALLQEKLATITQGSTHSAEGSLTTAQYIERFSPPQSTYTALTRYIKAAGFTITRIYAHRLFINFSGTIAQAEKAFHTTINVYAAPDAHLYFANSQDPILPTWLHDAMSSLNGLNNATWWNHEYKNDIQHQQAKHLLSNKTLATRCPHPGQYALTPTQLANAYNLTRLYQQQIQGEGQDIALFELGSLQMSDLTAYMSCFGNSTTRIEPVSTGTTSQIDASPLAAESDAELILSAAPQLRTLKIYLANNDETSYLTQWAQILADDTPIIATSWNVCEQAVPRTLIEQENIFFQMAALQGQNIFAASGDDGAKTCAQSYNAKAQGTMDPAAQPYVISIGGTSLSLQHDTAYGHEEAWQPSTTATGIPSESFSHYWPQPAWQHMVGIAHTPGTSSIQAGQCVSGCREIPDVALNADPNTGYWIYCSASISPCNPQQPWFSIGGTSTAAPLWAAFLALTDEAAQQAGQVRPGFITPLLYAIANNPVDYAQCFHDITATSPQTGQSPTMLTMVGYDSLTGLGSYQAWNLAQQLISQANPTSAVHNQVQIITGK